MIEGVTWTLLSCARNCKQIEEKRYGRSKERKTCERAQKVSLNINSWW